MPPNTAIVAVLLTTCVVAVSQSQYVMEEKRNATYELQNFIRSLDVAKDKVPPLRTQADGNQTVQLRASLAIMYIRSVNDAEQTVTTSSFIQMYWQDKALAWNKSLYSDVSFIEVSADVVWTPGVIIANSIETMKAKEFIDTLIIHSNGLVETKVFLSIETFCPLDHTLFPYDEQECPILLYAFSSYIMWNISSQSWTDSAEAQRVLASDWDLVKSFPTLMYLPQYQKEVPMVMLYLKRKTLYYSVCLILPMVLTSYMNTLVFLLPLQAGEKISFLVTICVSTSVFIGFFSDTMPRGLNEMPSSMKILIHLNAQSLLVLIATLLVLRVHHHQKASRTQTSSSDDFPDEQELSQDRTGHSLHKEPASPVLTDLDQVSRDELTGPNRCIFPPRFCGQTKNRVSPSSVLSKQDLALQENRESEGRMRWCKNAAHRLDGFFFVLFFVGNTVVHGIILFTELHVGKKSGAE